jgi:hypothetical protein
MFKPILIPSTLLGVVFYHTRWRAEKISIAAVCLGLFPRFFFCGLSKPHSGTTAVLIDELDAGQLEGSSHNIQGRATRLTSVLFELVDNHDADARALIPALVRRRCG